MNFKELNTKLGGDEEQSDWRQASGGGWIHKSAKVDDENKICEQAFGDAQVFGDAWVSGNAWEKSPLFILGSRFSLTNAKKGHIQIGCKCRTFDWWLKNGKRLAKEHGFTAAEIKEYAAYVKLFKDIGK